jgi:Flp pilus assembly protein TadD
MKNRFAVILSLFVISSGFLSCQKKEDTAGLMAPLFDNLGNYTVKISTNSDLAQRLFSQGLNLAYGFNHNEAARAFREAARIDTTCAMCNWGIAYVLGPNYNAGMEEDVKKEAYDASRKALSLSENVNPWEKVLIGAIVARYNYDKTDDRALLDQDYAEAMKNAYTRFPKQDDIATIYAESLLNLHPWDLYTHAGETKPWTPDIVSLLEEILDRSPEHPGANHFYIHAVEASANPGQGLAAAGRLTDLVPGSGHLVHMPSHIYIRTGHYHEGSLVNERASLADSLYIVNCNAQGIYPLAYYPHNLHFLTACAALEGKGETAINTAYRVAANTNVSLMREPGLQTLQHYSILPFYVLTKFSQWDKILTLPKPDDDLIYPIAIWHCVRGMAFAAKADLANAHSELLAVQEIGRNSKLAEITIWNINSVNHLVNIASRILEAELSAKAGDFDRAVTLLTEAVEIEDGLTYNEPPDWFFSVRHSLGAVMLQAGRYAEAEKTYLEDLDFYPENGFALNGLYLSLMNQGKMEEANFVKARFDKAWEFADIQLVDSRVMDIAYQNINSDPGNLTLLVEVADITACRPIQSGVSLK